MEVKYCVDHAIPHSTFLSWPEEDQDKVIEYLVYEGRRCHRCGTFPDDWIDPVTKRPIDPPPHVVDSTRCHGCAALDNMQEMVGKGPHRGLYFHMIPWERRRPDLEEEDYG